MELQYTSDDGSSWTAIDIFGAEGTDGSGEDWEYLDSWAKSKPTRATATTFSSSNWIYGSPNALDGESTNASATTPFPIKGAPITGDSGFRMMSSPKSGTIFSDLLADLWIQGMTGGDITGGTANVWTLSGQSWSALSNLSTASLTAGQGFLVYVYADTDADSEGEEGKFFVWTPAEIESVLGAEAEIFSGFFGVTQAGNFEGKNILNIKQKASDYAREQGIALEFVAQTRDSALTIRGNSRLWISNRNR